MVNLMRANEELFKRPPDECFESLSDLRRHCYDLQEASSEAWCKPQTISAIVENMRLAVRYDDGEVRSLNEWSFGQLCNLCKISPATINRLSVETATKAINETLPSADRPIQFLNGQPNVRSIHGINYTRLWNTELLDVVDEYASDFGPPKKARNGHGTGLYAGERDLFAFLVDEVLGSKLTVTVLHRASLSGTAKLAVARWGFRRFGISTSAETISFGIASTLTNLRASIPPACAMD